MRVLVTFLWMSTLLVGQSEPDVTTVLQQGARLVDAGQLSAAQDLYEKALLNFPQNSDLRFELGMVFFRQHNWPQAIENYKSSLGAEPGMIKPLYYLAESYFMESDLDRARATIAQAAAIAPDDAQVCQKYGEYLSVTIDTGKDGLSWLEKARRLNPGLPRIDFEIGKTQFALTDFPSAASTFEITLRKDPNNREAAFLLGESRAKLGDWGKARDAYTYAVAHGYEKGPAYYGLGRANVELEDFPDAVQPLRRSIALQPSLVQAHFQLAKAYRQLGRTKEARDETRLFDAMTDRVDTSELKSPEEEQAWKTVKPLLEANKEPEALELLAKSSAADASGQGEPHYLLGTMYYSMGRRGDARRTLILARAKDPQSARIAAYLGMVQLSAGDALAAESSFQAALALNSAETLALIGMGGIRYHQQRWSDAIQYLEKSRTADPDALFLLCDSYYREGKPDEALLTAEVIRALGADRTQLIDRLNQLAALHQPSHLRGAP